MTAKKAAAKQPEKPSATEAALAPGAPFVASIDELKDAAADSVVTPKKKG